MTLGSSSEVRDWAREQGLQVGDRGRLPASVMERYAAAHAGGGTSKPDGAEQKATAASTKPRATKASKPSGAASPRRTRRATSAESSSTPSALAAVKAAPAKRASATLSPRSVADVGRAAEHEVDQPTSGPEPVYALQEELERVREQVAVLQRDLDSTKARVAELEQRRGLFNRAAGRRR